MSSINHWLRLGARLLVVCLLVVSSFASLVPSAHAAPGPGVSWYTQANPMPYGANQFAAVVVNNRVYIMGGSTTSDNNQVYYAPISENNTIGTWIADDDLPSSNFRHTAVASGNYIYLIGGRDGPALPEVYSAHVNPDGTLDAWVDTNQDLPTPLYYASSFVYDGYIYVVGGDDNSQAVDTVYTAEIIGDGTIGAWVADADVLPVEINGSSVVVSGGYAYLIGGYTYADQYVDTVYSAPLSADGGIGAWTSQPQTLPQGVAYATAFVLNGDVFLVGGAGSGGWLNTVYATTLQSSGALDAWSSSSEQLAEERLSPASVVHDGVAYVLGGRQISGGVFLDSILATSAAIPDPVLGCTDADALNYNSLATQDDGSCEYPEPEEESEESTPTVVYSSGQGTPWRPVQTSNGVVAVPATTVPTENTCSLVVTQNLTKGAQDGKFHTYTKAVVTEVKILQAWLNKWGYAAGIEDGVFGVKTEMGVKKFQQASQIRSDGRVGPITRSFINQKCAANN